MKLSKLLLVIMTIFAMFIDNNNAAPKIPMKAIKKGGESVVSILIVYFKLDREFNAAIALCPIVCF